MSSTTATPEHIAATAHPDQRQIRRVAWASLVGTALESYDFYVYAYFAAFFVGPLFFEPLGTVGAVFTAFLTIAIAFVVRPIGALVFGHIGDRLGRRPTLIITITLMGVATGLIGVLPSYAQAGWFGAIVLVLLRTLQGLSLGGEWGGAILLATEGADPKRKALYAALPQLGSPIGSILSGALFLLMFFAVPAEQMVEWGWRIPFLTAIPLLLVSLYLRWSVTETPVFRELDAGGLRPKFPFGEVWRSQPKAVIVAIGAALLGIGSYSLMNTYTMNYGSTPVEAGGLGFDYMSLLIATTIGGLLQLVTIPLFGLWATRIGSARIVGLGGLTTLAAAFPIYLLLTEANFGVLVALMVVGGVLPTLAWAGLGGLMRDLFDPRYAYTALGFAYAIAATLTAFIPNITLIVGEASGNAWWHPAIVLAVLSAITLVAAIAADRMVRAGKGAPDAR
ncbi:MAG TPA: MFS transporter [Microbacteriaceae bacterium]|nr:MFS transporter [Microbacteriaceae bacterium]